MSTTPIVSTGGVPARLTSASACTALGGPPGGPPGGGPAAPGRGGGVPRGGGAGGRRGGAGVRGGGGGAGDGGGAHGAPAAVGTAARLGRQPGEPVQDLLAGPQVAGEPGSGAGEVRAVGVLAGGVHREVEGGR